jgi:hypothetical protein
MKSLKCHNKHVTNEIQPDIRVIFKAEHKVISFLNSHIWKLRYTERMWIWMWQKVQLVSPREGFTKPIMEDHAPWSRWEVTMYMREIGFKPKVNTQPSSKMKTLPPIWMPSFHSCILHGACHVCLELKRNWEGGGIKGRRVGKKENLKQHETALLSIHSHQHGLPYVTRTLSIQSHQRFGVFSLFNLSPSSGWFVSGLVSCSLHYINSVKWIYFLPGVLKANLPLSPLHHVLWLFPLAHCRLFEL